MGLEDRPTAQRAKDVWIATGGEMKRSYEERDREIAQTTKIAAENVIRYHQENLWLYELHVEKTKQAYEEAVKMLADKKQYIETVKKYPQVIKGGP